MQDLDPAEVATAEMVFWRKGQHSGGGESRVQLGSKLQIIDTVQRAKPAESDTRSAVAPGEQEWAVRKRKVTPVPVLRIIQSALIGEPFSGGL
jgi:hypothetical protein